MFRYHFIMCKKGRVDPKQWLADLLPANDVRKALIREEKGPSEKAPQKKKIRHPRLEGTSKSCLDGKDKDMHSCIPGRKQTNKG